MTAEQPAGIEALTGSGGATQRLAVLREALRELAEELADDLKPSRGCNLEIELSTLDAGKAADMLSAHAESIAGAAIRAEQWDATLLAGIDRDFLFSLIDTLFGGDGTGRPFQLERPLSFIETEICGWLFGRVAMQLETTFRSLADVSFTVASTDCPPAFDSIGRPSNPIAAATFELRCPAGKGRLFIALPQSSLTLLRPPASNRAMPSHQAAADPSWTRLLGNQLGRADVAVRAILGSTRLTLGDVAELQPGKIIKLEALSQNRVRLECNDEPLYWCKLGQSQGRYTLSVDDAIDHEQEFMDDILSR